MISAEGFIFAHLSINFCSFSLHFHSFEGVVSATHVILGTRVWGSKPNSRGVVSGAAGAAGAAGGAGDEFQDRCLPIMFCMTKMAPFCGIPK